MQRPRLREITRTFGTLAFVVTLVGPTASSNAIANTRDAPREAHEQLQGRWAKRTHLETLTELPIVGEIAQETDVISLVELRAKANGEWMYREKTCRLTSKTLAGLIETSYPPGFLRVLAKDWQPARVVEEGAALVVEQPHGVRQYGFVGDAVPRDKDDARVRDSDQDGHPGVTIQAKGLIGGEIYAAVEEWSEVRGEVVAPDYVRGLVRWGTDFAVLDASSRILSGQPKTRLRPDPSAHHFEMRKVPARANCRAVLARLDQVFAN